jgi:hypothetical protein
VEILPFVPGPTEFPDHVYQAAFHLWAFECNQNCRATARRVKELRAIEATAYDLEDELPSPSHDTIDNWKHRDRWPQRVVDLLAADKTAGAMFRQQQALFFIGRNRLALSLFEDLDGGKMQPRDKIEFLKVLDKQFLEPALAAPPELPFTPTKAIESGPRSREDVAAAQLERLRKAKQARKGKH